MSYYALNRDERVAIFNRVFHDCLRSQGLRHGLNAYKLEVQYRDRLRPRTIQQWAPILRDPVNALERADRDANRLSVAAAAAALNIPLRVQVQQHQAAPLPPAAEAGQDQENDDPNSDTSPSTDETEDDSSLLSQAPDISSKFACSNRRARFEHAARLLYEGSSEASVPCNDLDVDDKREVLQQAKHYARFRTDVEGGERVLSMIHSSALEWNAAQQQRTVDAFSGLDEIELDDPLYMHGGPVCRISRHRW